MTATRRHTLAECSPRWVQDTDGVTCYLHFDCPEGHSDCSHTIPFSPSLEGTDVPSPQRNGARWDRKGDTFETVTLSPSIRRIQRYASREAAIAAGCIPEYVTESMTCAFHGFVRDGRIEFCGDSK